MMPANKSGSPVDYISMIMAIWTSGAAFERTSMGDLRGKVAVVTGASKGIGAAIAKRLSTAGAAVMVNYSYSKEDADRVVADIKAKGGRAIAVKGDVARAEDVRQLFDETKKAFGRLDVLVNNAGVYKFIRPSWVRDKSALMPLRRAASRPRECIAAASWAAISRKP
jgi:NAD(P)-dependent dehydrogenase (short-subunit alcohol dehydrogenase family)